MGDATRPPCPLVAQRGGLRPLPFGNPSRSWTGERQRKEKQRVSYLHPVVLHARRCGGALIEIQV